ncbi:Clavaminate synthase-like protein [Lichtheimia hyalospora FSU 10163]|nr:Clavaminate synthase-like protein [Lichtheimia hyalospora FSU 10163]
MSIFYRELLHLLEQLPNNLKGCDPSAVHLLESIVQGLPPLPNRQHEYTRDLEHAEALLDLAQESILLYPYKSVPACWRCMIMDAGVLKALCLLGQEDGQLTLDCARRMICVLDTVIIISGAPGPHRRQVALETIQGLQDWIAQEQQDATSNMSFNLGSFTSDIQDPVIARDHSVPRLAAVPSFVDFVTRITTSETPFIIPIGAIDHWPALEKWHSVPYLISVAGDRMVPVEIGSKYTDQDWQQKLMRFEDFLRTYILSNDNNTDRPSAYLAQHDLFHQIPRLANDIITPDYCFCEPEPSELYPNPPPDVIQNAWFGPKGTVSPLHHDPYHNVLAQPVGRKYIRLYAPSQTKYLYPHQGIMSNTSQIDVEHPDQETFPLVNKAEYLECILQQGELLYMPPRWWHYIRSLSTSFSVSFWF